MPLEPAHGKVIRSAHPIRGHRFVVLNHTDVAEPHYDLMIDPGSQAPLITFRLMRWPPTDAQDVVRLPDHRRIYLSYEGPVSGERGQVRRISEGSARPDGAGWLLCTSEGRPLGIVQPLQRNGQTQWTLRPIETSSQ
jgi:hypothetical protein